MGTPWQRLAHWKEKGIQRQKNSRARRTRVPDGSGPPPVRGRWCPARGCQSLPTGGPHASTHLPMVSLETRVPFDDASSTVSPLVCRPWRQRVPSLCGTRTWSAWQLLPPASRVPAPTSARSRAAWPPSRSGCARDADADTCAQMVRYVGENQRLDAHHPPPSACFHSSSLPSLPHVLYRTIEQNISYDLLILELNFIR